MSSKAKGVGASDHAALAKGIGHAMGIAIKRERRRNRWHFLALWLAFAALALYVVLR